MLLSRQPPLIRVLLHFLSLKRRELQSGSNFLMKRKRMSAPA